MPLGLGYVTKGLADGYTFVDEAIRTGERDKRQREIDDMARLREGQERAKINDEEAIRRSMAQTQPPPGLDAVAPPVDQAVGIGSASAVQPSLADVKPKAPDQFQALREQNARLMAGSAEAGRRGRWDTALDLHTKGMQLRDQLRSVEGDSFRTRYEATKDPNVYVPYLSQYVGDGIKYKSITKMGDKFVVDAENTYDGKPIRQELDASQMERLIKSAQDPAGLRKLEADQAAKLQEARIKMQEIAAQHRFKEVNGVLVDTLTRERYDMRDVKFRDIMDADGKKVGTEVWTADGRKISDDANPILRQRVPEQVLKIAGEASSFVYKGLGAGGLQGLDPNTRQQYINGSRLASDLVMANYSTPTGATLTAERAGDLGLKMASGEIKPRKLVDGPYAGEMAVEYEGQKYLVDPSAISKRMNPQAWGQEPPRPANPAGFEAPRTENPANFQFDMLIRKLGLSDGAAEVARSIYAQESSSGRADTSKVNSSNVTGPMQVQEATFNGLKQQGLIPPDADWRNPQHNIAAGITLIKQLDKQYNGDPNKIAAAYYAGTKAVAPDGSIRNFRDLKNPGAPTTQQYVDQVVGRVKGLGTRQVSGTVQPAGPSLGLEELRRGRYAPLPG